MRPHVVFLAYAAFSPLERNVVIASERLDPLVVFGGALPQHLLESEGDSELGFRRSLRVAVTRLRSAAKG